MIDLRLGCWQDVLADVTCDAIICDPPYGNRTHASVVVRDDASGRTSGLCPDYSGWSPDDVRAFVTSWSSRCRGWMVTMTSHDLIPAWEAAHDEVGRYCFAPIPLVMRGMSVRMAGDGPSSWAVYAVVARPSNREFAAWGTLPGAYTGPRGDEAGGGRGKPEWLMNGLVRDYSRAGDLVCDPFAGWGSTLVAAVSNNRKAIGSEVDPGAFAEATRRIQRPLQLDVFGGAAWRQG